MLGAAPFASLGFITYQSMNAEQIVMTAWHSFLLSKRSLIDKPFNLYHEMFKDVFEKRPLKPPRPAGGYCQRGTVFSQ